MILQDLVENLTQDLKAFIGKILESSWQELIKNLAKPAQDLVAIYIQDLDRILIKSYRILSTFLLKLGLTRSCTRFF